MNINDVIEDLRIQVEQYDGCDERAEKLVQIAEWLENYKHMRFQIGEVLVSVSKQHISYEKAIEKIRDIERKYY